jgi:WD40-like Beta Propeller Repeat
MARPWAVALLLAMAACGGGTEPDSGPGLRIVSGDGVVDTAGAELALPLVVELRDSSDAPVPNAQIQFESRDCHFSCAILVAGTDATGFGFGALETTGRDGRVQVRVKLGFVAGDGRIRITSNLTSQVAAAVYTIRHGALGGVQALPADTALYVGRGYRIRATTFDRSGNARSGDPIDFQMVDGPATVSDDGEVTATGEGRASVEVRSGAVRDTISLSIIPTGTLAARLLQDHTELHLFGLDGSGLDVIAESGFVGGGVAAWSPDGSVLAFQQSTSPFDPKLYLSDLVGPPRRLLPADSAAAEFTPRFSRDGSWIYYHAEHDGRAAEIWRAHPDGTGLERVGAQAPDNQAGDFDPDPSPDGTRVAFASSRSGDGFELVIRTLATGAESRPGLAARMPRWSPDGSWIAYWRPPESGLLGTIRLVRPDGSEDHAVGRVEGHYDSGLDWSPDGRWLLARGGLALELLDASTGEVLTLGYSTAYDWAVWRPE